MKYLTLTQGKYAKVDDADYQLLSAHRWCYSTGYAITRIGKKLVRMHNFLVDAPKGKEIDHIDGDKLNNTRQNLRIATRSQNMANRKTYPNNSSGYKGVSRNGSKWLCRIGVKGNRVYLGTYETREEAKNAYNSAALKYFGEFALVN